MLNWFLFGILIQCSFLSVSADCEKRLTAKYSVYTLYTQTAPPPRFRNTNCSIVITADDEGSLVRLIVESDTFHQYRYDSLGGIHVYDGDDGASDLYLGSYYGAEFESVFVSSSSSLSLVFPGSLIPRSNSFTIRYAVDDDFIVSVTSSERPRYVRSPGYPGLPSAFTEHNTCAWNIEAAPGHRIILTINYPQSIPYDAPLCNSTTVYDGINDHGGRRQIGASCPGTNKTFVSWGNYIQVVTRNTILELRFQAESYTPCEFHMPPLLNTKEYNITSNKTDTECRWYISVENLDVTRQSIHINVSAELSESSCETEYLKIYPYDQPTVQAVADLCGSETGQTYEFYIRSLLVVYKAGPDAKGFVLKYRLADTTCKDSHRAKTKTKSITSPNFPQAYPSFQRCEYLLRTYPQGLAVHLNVMVSQLNTDCSVEYVEVYDGSTVNDPKLGRWCGYQRPIYKGLQSSMLVVFVSGFYSMSGNGFMAEFKKVECGATLTVGAVKRTLSSPGYPSLYYSAVTCVWYFKAVSTEHKILLYFTQVNVRCPFSQLTVFFGHTVDEYRWVSICGDRNHAYISRTDGMVVRLTQRPYSIPGIKYKITYKSYDFQGCSGAPARLYAGEEAKTLTTPGYPDFYPDNAVCSWIITADYDQSIKLVFGDISLDGRPGCSDKMKIYEGSTPLQGDLQQEICDSSSLPFFSESRSVLIQFTSDDVSAGRGFSLQYKAYSGDAPSGDDYPAANEEQSKEKTIVAIVGTVLTFLLLVIISIVVCVCVYRRRSRRRQLATTSDAPPVQTLPNHQRQQSAPFLVPAQDTPNFDEPPPSFTELESEAGQQNFLAPSAPELPPPSYEDAVSKGMILSSSTNIADTGL